MVEEYLVLAGAAVHSSADGVHLIDHLATTRYPYDLLLLDVMTPVTSGYEITQQLRKQYSQHELPIILLTARTLPNDIVLGFQVGANDYLAKPFTRTELIARCHMHLELRRSIGTLEKNVTLERKLQEHRHQAESTNLRVVSAELEKLRYQVNPHLLFNTLTSVRGIVSSNPVAAREMIGMLAEYYRLTLAIGSRSAVSLAEEVKLARTYLNIEQARHLRADTVTWAIDPHAEHFLVPALLLQPIIENAIRYGRNNPSCSSLVHILAQFTESRTLLLRVSNTGCWVQSVAPSPERCAIGHENVRQRLALYYGKSAELTYWSDADRVHVEINLPYPARDIETASASAIRTVGTGSSATAVY